MDLVATAATGGTSLCVGVPDGESVSEVGVLDVLDDAWLECLLGLVVEVEGESLDSDLVGEVALVLCEGHSELRSGACHSTEVDLDSVSLFAVLGEEVVDEINCFVVDRNHSNRRCHLQNCI